jgi:hypothetical protein
MTVELQKNVDTSINNRAVTIREWAESSLTAEELADFYEAEKRNSALTKHYIDSGLYQQESITETVYVPAIGASITVPIGQKTILAPGVTILDIPIDPEFSVWHARYTSDPNVNYNPTVQL